MDNINEEPLVYLPVNRWEELKDLFKSDWPRCISGFTVLENQERILQLGLDYGFKVYCPFGELSNGMVAMNIKNNIYEVLIQTHSDDTYKLVEALKYTKVIDWKQSLQINYVPNHVMNCVRKIILDKRLRIDYIKVLGKFFLDINKSLFEDVRIPRECTFKLLSLKYIDILNSNWPHRYPDSSWYFELLIRANLGYGLFKEKELIAWVFVNETGALGHLYTLEAHRRKGYGELVLKLISNVLLKQGKFVVAYCVKGNTAAYKIFEKVGFESTDEVEWCTLAECK